MENKLPQGLIGKMLVRLVGGIAVLGACFFLPAKTFNYWQAWVYLGVVLIPLMYVAFYFMKRDPEFLLRRMKTKEKVTAQKWIIGLSGIPLLLVYLLPGFDVRLGWSKLPVWLVLAADLISLAGYILVILVFKENHFASRVVEVSEGQKVIDTGPYALVRHPMYLGTAIMYLFSPLALGSFWAVIPALVMVPVLVARIISEEKLLVAELPGYAEYKQKVRSRMLPGIW
jgi:protein-S-isoprenylcysteine O-methyltransferase Ste14